MARAGPDLNVIEWAVTPYLDRSVGIVETFQ
jgi:hypothetical protein